MQMPGVPFTPNALSGALRALFDKLFAQRLG